MVPAVTLKRSVSTYRNDVVSQLCDWFLNSMHILLYWISRCKGERQYRTLISLLVSLATMRRVVNYHSSWARQRQGNPGFTAGRGFNPAGGATGGG
ncbi:hypothetical protein F511_33386 [Dorcoceras hygrometricum]|uniref:Uncharacterized protein n=1 Tax=Dorcoceras hygrometricum TaxID=472368 RepID=A0A2Z7DGR2_9LAMI|nr:hypothetical protein F511_33386 [Dorcoceras hygrometricum]